MMLLRKVFGVSLCLYLQFVTISCDEGGSLAFAIDDTGSMYDDIMYVRQGARAIMNLVFSKKSDIRDLVLVTFNDPGVQLRAHTRDGEQHQFLNALSAIQPDGGWDCPEMSLKGTQLALENSNPGSYIFVFTDANAKDFDKIQTIKSLCQKKQSQVLIVYTRSGCYKTSGEEFTVYYEIAKACSGQVFIVNKEDINSILKTIETLLQGKNSIFKWITIPRTNKSVPVPFTLDEKAEYAIVSTSGENVNLKVTKENFYNSPQVNIEKIMWTANSKVVKLIKPEPGVYYAWVKGESTISVVVYGRTDFTFGHGFSILEPKSLKDTTPQPKAGLKQHVTINVTDADNSVNIQKLQILDIGNNDRIVKDLPLRNIGEFYMTEAFVSPNYTFKIAVIGKIKKTGEEITRYSKNIIPLIVDLIPESRPDIKIEEGPKLDVNYGSRVTLSCKVTAHPAPIIEWYTSSGRLLQSQSAVIDDPLFVSYLKLENIKQTETYICKASNRLGRGRDSTTQVGINPIFTNIGKAIYNAEYGKDNKIPCDIKSYLPVRTKWFRYGRQLSGNSGKHSISPDGSELTLKSMDIEMQGIYTCEVSLNSDPTIKQARTRDVQIFGLAPPKVILARTILKDKTLTAICRFAGVPKPIISWQFKQKGSEVFRPISGSEEELTIHDVRLKDSGVYKCVGKNILGDIQEDLNVVVKEPPTIYNEESTFYGVEGDLVIKIPCNVTGFPEPTISWKKEDVDLKTDSKYKIQGNALYINLPAVSDSGEYTCKAENEKGTDTKTFVVEIVESSDGGDNFDGNSHDIYAEQGKPIVVKCNVRNAGDGSVRWYKDGILTKVTGSTYTIERVSITDEGNYTCRVNTNEGSTSETYVLSVGFPPHFEDSTPSPITVDWQDDQQLLDCAAESTPPAKYEWFYSEEPLKTENDLQQLSITDWGHYTCRVSNVLGNISKTFNVKSSGCYITKNIASKKQPLVSDKDTLAWPASVGNSDILLKTNEEVKLSCPNNKKLSNTFKLIPSKPEIVAKCNTQDKLTVDGKTYTYSDLQCNTEVEPSLLATREQCYGPNSETIRVGFEVNGFLEAYKVCFDRRLNVPLYASVPTLLLRSSDRVDSTKFIWSPTPELSKQRPGNWKPEGSCKCCYSQGQLVNVKELAFGPAQAATFKEGLNSIPIWDSSCDDSGRMSWQTFESIMREMSLLNEKWSSWTGASQYVPKDGGLVPRYLWKVVNNDDGWSVMVYVNDKSPVDSDIRCSSPCDTMIEADKFLYCCTLNEFSRSFGVPLDGLKSD